MGQDIRAAFVVLPLALVTIAGAPVTFAATTSTGGTRSTHASAAKSGHKHKSTKPRESTPYRAPAVARGSHNRIQRSEAAKAAFMRETGFPHGRPGYVVDHIVPLACGGLDAASNMQWQTIEAAKAKDKTERSGCR